MSYKRWYAGKSTKSDANQKPIVECFRKMGASVWALDRPVDLIVGYAGKMGLVEVKNREGKDKISPDQKKFFEEWKGPLVPIAYGPDDCETILRAIAKGL